MPEAYILNVQKYSIHDGDGIRTTIFFKGCPLSCLWCHNPESQRYTPELIYNREKCTLCLGCISSCAASCIKLDDSGSIIQARDCPACGACADICLSGAREIAGKIYTVSELMEMIDKDAMFYEQSGGGITLSGGEVMSTDMDFVEDLLKQCKIRGYFVNIDTCGYAPFSSFERIRDYVDVFLYDIKLMNVEKHKRFTGCGNTLILGNLKKLSQSGAKIYIRIPLIEDINCADADIEPMITLLNTLHIERVYLMPHHQVGIHKATWIGRETSVGLQPPSDERLGAIAAKFRQHGYHTQIEGKNI